MYLPSFSGCRWGVKILILSDWLNIAFRGLFLNIFKIYVRPTEPCNYKKHTIGVLSSQKPLLIISQYLKVHVERHAISTLTPVLVLDFFCEVA